MRTSIIAVTILVPAAASAGGYILPNSNPRDLALSQSAVAAQNGAEALFLNTAALAGQEGLDVSVSGEVLLNQTDWSAPGEMPKSQSQSNFPPALAISYGDKLDNGMGWGAGVGVNLPAGGSLGWPHDWAGREYIQSVSQRVFAIAVGAAFQPLPYLKVGATYLRFQATEELHQSINFLDHFGDAGLAMSGGANGFGVAVEFQVPTIPLTIGSTYSHSAHLSLSGHAHFTDVPTSLQTLLHDQGVTEDLTIPNVFFVGAAYEVIPNLKVMAAYNLERWSTYKSDIFVGAGGFTVTVPRDYKNAYVFRIGGEWENTPFLPGLTLRAGFLRSISPQPADTISPSLTDGDSWAPSIGAGYNVMPNLRIDLGAQVAFLDSVTACTPANGCMSSEAFPGTYKTKVEFFSLGLNWRSDLAFLSGGKK